MTREEEIKFITSKIDEEIKEWLENEDSMWAIKKE